MPPVYARTVQEASAGLPRSDGGRGADRRAADYSIMGRDESAYEMDHVFEVEWYGGNEPCRILGVYPLVRCVCLCVQY